MVCNIVYNIIGVYGVAKGDPANGVFLFRKNRKRGGNIT